MDAKEFNELLKNIHNKECFKKIYNEFYPIIVKFVVSRFSDKELAKDIAHDIFADFLRKDFHYINEPKSYIIGASKNLALKYIKNKNCNINLDDCDSYYFITDIYDQGEISELLKNLNKEDREIIELKWFHGYTLIEIADMKGYSLFSLQKRHQRILKKLKQIK